MRSVSIMRPVSNYRNGSESFPCQLDPEQETRTHIDPVGMISRPRGDLCSFVIFFDPGNMYAFPSDFPQLKIFFSIDSVFYRSQVPFGQARQHARRTRML